MGSKYWILTEPVRLPPFPRDRQQTHSQLPMTEGKKAARGAILLLGFPLGLAVGAGGVATDILDEEPVFILQQVVI